MAYQKQPQPHQSKNKNTSSNNTAGRLKNFESHFSIHHHFPRWCWCCFWYRCRIITSKLSKLTFFPKYVYMCISIFWKKKFSPFYVRLHPRTAFSLYFKTECIDRGVKKHIKLRERWKLNAHITSQSVVILILCDVESL